MASVQNGGSGGGSIQKSNVSSMDNTLAHPIAPTYYNNQNNTNNNNYNTQSQKQPATSGGIIKSNYTSADNPLSYSGYSNNQPTNDYNSTQYNTYGNYNEQPAGGFADQAARRYDTSLESYRKVPADVNNGGYYSAPVDQYRSFSQDNNNNTDQYLKSQQQQQPMDQFSYGDSQPMMNMNSNGNNNNNNDVNKLNSPRRDIRSDVDIMNKQAYKRALDQQVAEKEVMKYKQEKDKIRSEIDSIKQYPFGRRTDPSSYVNNDTNMMNNNMTNSDMFIHNQPSYEPSFVNQYPHETMNQQLQPPMRQLNKDNIVEKPNSLNADIPPYDPIKHRNGFHQGYNYDPWGKPGGGAPLIDPNTGRKFTKYSGQVWYDTIGLSPDDRAKLYADRNRPLTLEEQRREVEVEKQRKREEEAVYKSRAGDVATWITEIENQRKKNNVYGAHLLHTNVTREKINLEYARRNVKPETRSYHDELGVQLEERHRNNKLHKLKDDVAGIEHTRKWDDWWGKPGGGAPNSDFRRRDLKETLESPRELSRNNSSDQLPTSLQMGSYRNANDQSFNNALYAKGTVRSNHKNLYDNLQEMKL